MRIDVIPVYQSYPSSTVAPRAAPQPREADNHPRQPDGAPRAPRFKADAVEFAHAEPVLEARPLTTNPRQAHAMQTFQAVAEPAEDLHIIDLFA